MARSEAAKCLDRITRARRLILKAVEQAAEVDLHPGHLAEMRRRLEAIRDEARKLELMLEGNMTDLQLTCVKDLRAGDRTPWYEVKHAPEQRPDKAYRYQVLVYHFDTGVTDYVWGYGDEQVPVHR